MAIDRFGNVALSVRGSQLEEHGFALGDRIEISAGAGRYYALRARTFADVRQGEMVVFDDSSGWAALAMNSGSIVDICDITRGDMVDLRLT
jgi:S-adenosylmethionine hydrolase